MKTFIIALLLAVASATLLNDPEIAKKINSGNYGWKAAEHNKFSSKTWEEKRAYVGAFVDPVHAGLPIQTRKVKGLPDNFNWAEEKPELMVPIRDQAHCGSCWAFSAAEALGNRFSIKNGTALVLSPQHLVSCDNREMGCDGGYPVKVWQFMAETGVVTDECYPYTSGEGETGTCLVKKAGAKCPSKKGVSKYYKAKNNRQLEADEETIMTEIYENGPVGVAFKVYQDFFSYKSGVYRHVSGGLAGGHAVMTVGWGVDEESGDKYWIVQNSWGEDWGNQGYFWILRGEDECGIESFATMAADPVL